MSYENIEITKSMYGISGKTFSQVLSESDPDSNYKGTALENLDAFQRQLKRFGIKVSGENSDMVEKFFQTADSAALFPEYVSRAVRSGMYENDILSKIVASKTVIDTLDYRAITAVGAFEDNIDVKNVAEGAFIPETIIKSKESLVKLNKRGRMLVASYEAIKFQKLDVLTVTLKQIGLSISKVLLKDAVDALLKGDGAPTSVVTTAATNILSFADLINLWSQFKDYTLNTLLVSTDMLLRLLSIEEFKNPLTGVNFAGTGAFESPLGTQVIKCDALPEGTIVGFDKTCALEMVQAGEVMLESDKLIDRQLERTAVTVIAGFTRIYPDSCVILNLKTD